MPKNPIISVEELSLLLSNTELVLLDATIDKVNQKIDSFNPDFIPNSLFFDIEHSFSDNQSTLPHSMLDEEAFGNAVKSLGINANDTIVIYDRWGVYSSPRAWWMFRAMGHQNTYVLDGGLIAWKEADLPTVKRHRFPSEKGNFMANENKNWIETKESLLQKLGDSSITLNDARSSGRFNGTSPEPRAGMRSGHIPSSTNIPFDNILNGAYLKDSTQLKEIYRDKVSSSKHNIFTCGSGITAAILALAAYKIGNHDVAVYDGSWSEWGAESTLPIEQDS